MGHTQVRGTAAPYGWQFLSWPASGDERTRLLASRSPGWALPANGRFPIRWLEMRRLPDQAVRRDCVVITRTSFSTLVHCMAFSLRR